jgi:hypothetical protein
MGLHLTPGTGVLHPVVQWFTGVAAIGVVTMADGGGAHDHAVA